MQQNQNCSILFYIKRNGNQNKLCNRERLENNISGVVWRGRSPSISNPQQRHARCEENFCGAELAPREQKFFPCAFAARESHSVERSETEGVQSVDCRPKPTAKRMRRAWGVRDERQRRGGARKGDVSPFRGLCSSPLASAITVIRLLLPRGLCIPRTAWSDRQTAPLAVQNRPRTGERPSARPGAFRFSRR